MPLLRPLPLLREETYHHQDLRPQKGPNQSFTTTLPAGRVLSGQPGGLPLGFMLSTPSPYSQIPEIYRRNPSPAVAEFGLEPTHLRYPWTWTESRNHYTTVSTRYWRNYIYLFQYTEGHRNLNCENSGKLNRPPPVGFEPTILGSGGRCLIH